MWIRTQNKQNVFNSDQIVDIFIDKTGTKICADTTNKEYVIVLGEYSNRQACLRVLDLLLAMITSEYKIYEMPLGGEVC